MRSRDIWIMPVPTQNYLYNQKTNSIIRCGSFWSTLNMVGGSDCNKRYASESSLAYSPSVIQPGFVWELPVTPPRSTGPKFVRVAVSQQYRVGCDYIIPQWQLFVVQPRLNIVTFAWLTNKTTLFLLPFNYRRSFKHPTYAYT